MPDGPRETINANHTSFGEARVRDCWYPRSRSAWRCICEFDLGVRSRCWVRVQTDRCQVPCYTRSESIAGI